MQIISLILFSFMCQASTFVGNGGGQGDIEIAASKQQLIETFQAIKDKKSSDYLCRCNENYENRPVCEPLKKLTPEQRQFCQKNLFEKANELLNLVKGSEVKISWTHDTIEVKEGKNLRAVDAVSDAEKKEITLNLPRFLDMKTYERVFLLSHEFLHMTKIDGQPIVDEGPLGPFAGSEGGRQFLNAMGSAISVLEGELPGVSSHKAMIMRSRSSKNFWFDLGAGKSTYQSSPSSSFGIKEYDHSQFSFRYYLGNFAFTAQLKNEYGDNRILDNEVKVKEHLTIYGLGIAYRIFPFENPLTFWGQSHILLQAQFDQVEAKISVIDNYVKFHEKIKTTGTSGSAKYYFPLFWGFWTYAGVGFESHPYKYSGINLKYDKSKTTILIGTSYAF